MIWFCFVSLSSLWHFQRILNNSLYLLATSTLFLCCGMGLYENWISKIMGNCSQKLPQTTISRNFLSRMVSETATSQTRNCPVITRRDKARRKRTSLMVNYYNRTGSNFVFFFLRGLMQAAYQPTSHIIHNNSRRLWRSLSDLAFVYVQTQCGPNHFAGLQCRSRLLPSEHCRQPIISKWNCLAFLISGSQHTDKPADASLKYGER